jgi:CMP-N-acetylneuraminic acid synthetase
VNAAIITARGGSQTIRDKNVMDVGGVPLMQYPIEAAQSARLVERVYVATNCSKVDRVADQLGAAVLRQSDELQDGTKHGEVIRDAVERVDEELQGELKSVVVLLGNTVMTDAVLIDEALETLDADQEVTGVMSVWHAGDDHPLRAMRIQDGQLVPYEHRTGVATNRQSYPSAYFYDQGVWAFRKECVRERSGPSPWWWMGSNVRPIHREWVTGRDIHTQQDAAIAEWWLSRQGVLHHDA